MAIYYLFLDELKPNERYKHFCLGGCIIEDMTYRNEVIPYINQLKDYIFNDTTVILHENPIRSKKDGIYKTLKNSEKETKFWNDFKTLFTKKWIYTMCVGIHYENYTKFYKSKSKIINSEYFIALQIILENFVHFLEEHNSKGAVYIESRGIEDDQRLQEQYNIIKNNGTLFIDKKVFNNRLKTISFPMKADNNIGIQLADFIPNPIARYLDGTEQRKFSLFEEIKLSCYDGNLNLIDRFGMKKVL